MLRFFHTHFVVYLYRVFATIVPMTTAEAEVRKVAFEIEAAAKVRSMQHVVGLPLPSTDKGVHRCVTWGGDGGTPNAKYLNVGACTA
jgi:hypothetical protein